MSEPRVLSTGLPGLDRVLHGLRPGDNVVWQVETVAEYAPFVQPYCADVRRRGVSLSYFRFARHRELGAETAGATKYELDPAVGFEPFVTQILDVIEGNGRDACYVFDCLSDLAVDWYSDQMLGNFFMIACPFLYALDTLAYFAVLRHNHTARAIEAITGTAQVVIDGYARDDEHYLQPLKVFERYSPTMYLLHRRVGDDFQPVTSSATLSEIMATLPQPWLDFRIQRAGVWSRTFWHAQETLEAVKSGHLTYLEADDSFHRLLRMAVTRDATFTRLAEKYFTLADLIEIFQRMIGTGLVGGKTVGMLLARAILEKSDPRWRARLETHDSFFVGSDVFYTYLVQNGCWWLRRRQRDPERYLEDVAEAQERILNGKFPDYIRQQFVEMLSYFGQSPIIVRSSSLLEDAYGNAFSGKYESVFCPNQGAPEARLEAFMQAVRRVYASAMRREALVYRAHRGLLALDEQMALLVQRVSGDVYGSAFFPQLAGVGYSYNPYVWDRDIDPHGGFLRLVLGLGTRAVNRVGDDYTRLVTLNAPTKRLEGDLDGLRRYSQHDVDVLSLAANTQASVPLGAVAPALPPWVLDLTLTADEELTRSGVASGHATPGLITFEKLLADTPFASEMQDLLRLLEAAYQHPVDVEFTANFVAPDRCRINLVQCRPFQARWRGSGPATPVPTAVPAADLILATTGPIIGPNRALDLDWLIYVVPAAYSKLPIQQRYSLAQVIGRLTHAPTGDPRPAIMLLGPGRWGTSSPSLGVPVSFADINVVSVIGEIAVMHEGLVPDVSLGTHFFNDLVELDMLYLALHPRTAGNEFNEAFFQQLPNRLATLLPDAARWTDALKVIAAADCPAGRRPCLHADTVQQRALCYLRPAP